MYYFGWSTICLTPPPQKIGLYSSPFYNWCLRQIQTLPSGGGTSRVHGLTTRREFFTVSVNVLMMNLIKWGEMLRKPTGLFGSLFPAGQIMAQEAAVVVPIVIPAHRGLQHCTGQPILQTPNPSGGGASPIDGSTTHQASVSI